jgi:hypothetical protein
MKSQMDGPYRTPHGRGTNSQCYLDPRVHTGTGSVLRSLIAAARQLHGLATR